MRILYITEWFPTEDDPSHGVFVMEHAKASALNGDVTLLALVSGNSNMREERELLNGKLKVVVRTVKRSKFYWMDLVKKTYLSLAEAKLMEDKGDRPDLIHGNVIATGLPIVLLKRRWNVPAVLTEHWSAFNRKLSMTKFFYIKAVSKYIDLFMPVSRQLQVAMEKYGVKGPYKVVPNVVDTDIFYSEDISSDVARKVGKPFKLLFVGRLSKVKRIDVLIEALAVIRKTGDISELHIIGDGEMRNECEDLSTRLGLASNIFFYGFKTKSFIAQLMRSVDLLVLPSASETFGCVLIEALATGLPVIATDVGGVKEIINKNNGTLIKVGDVGSLANDIRMAVSKLGDFDRKTIAKQAKDRYSYEAVGGQFWEAYRSVLYCGLKNGLVRK